MSALSINVRRLYEQKTIIAEAATSRSFKYTQFLPGLLGFKDANAIVSLLTAVEIFEYAHKSPLLVLRTLLPSMVTAAVRIGESKRPIPPCLTDSTVDKPPRIDVFSPYECYGIMSASFLCSFDRDSANSLSAKPALPSINLDEMFMGNFVPQHYEVESQKLLMFLDYYHQSTLEFQQEQRPADGRSFVVIRNGLPSSVVDQYLGQRGTRPFIPLLMHPLRESIDDQVGMLRVDFANAIIGGASLSFGCVQEEITFAVCPELNVARLMHESMGAGEAIFLVNSRQFSNVKPGTYASTLAYGGPCDKAFCSNAIVAIDAADYRGMNSRQQFHPVLLRRELLKLLAGFNIRSLPRDLQHLGAKIATGNWGCGCFRGDAELKLLLQWIAASWSDGVLELHYFPFNRDDLIANFVKLGDAIRTANVTPATVLHLLETHAQHFVQNKASVWSVVCSLLTGGPSMVR